MSQIVVFELVKGPQDGAKVHQIGDVMPQTIYVTSSCIGDIVVAWSRKCSKKFPCCYVMDGDKFVFQAQ